MRPRCDLESLEYKRAIAPQRKVEAGIIPGTSIGLEAKDQRRAGRLAQVVFEVLPGGVGPMHAQQFSRARHDPECHTVSYRASRPRPELHREEKRRPGIEIEGRRASRSSGHGVDLPWQPEPKWPGLAPRARNRQDWTLPG